jgi:tRNA dimethylallyltransferase
LKDFRGEMTSGRTYAGIIIAGPTAAGKSAIALSLAGKIGGEIVSADSMQVYKYMDIGTAKPGAEEQKIVKHHCIDIINPTENFNVTRYCEEAKKAFGDIRGRHSIPLLTGGTGLYIDMVVFGGSNLPPSDDNLRKELLVKREKFGQEWLHGKLVECDSESSKRIHPNDTKRIIRALEVFYTTGIAISKWQKKNYASPVESDWMWIGITRTREDLRKRIEFRAKEMFRNGLVEEVRKLMNMGCTLENTSMQGLGYKEIYLALKGEYSIESALNNLISRTTKYARRQLTWFKSNPEIEWINLSVAQTETEVCENLFAKIEKNSWFRG